MALIDPSIHHRGKMTVTYLFITTCVMRLCTEQHLYHHYLVFVTTWLVQM